MKKTIHTASLIAAAMADIETDFQIYIKSYISLHRWLVKKISRWVPNFSTEADGEEVEDLCSF